MNERQEQRQGKPVTVVERPRRPEELERQDLLARIAALEAEAAKRGHQPPPPPAGYTRR